MSKALINFICFYLLVANEDQVEKAKQIIKSLKFPFSSDSFENPALQKHYANVEAIALDKDETDDIEDLVRK